MGHSSGAYPGGHRIELHSGASAGNKAFLGGCLTLAALVLVPTVGLFTGVLASLLSTTAGVVAGVAITLAFEALLIGRLLWLLRSAAWLENTTLAVRGTFATRRCDLARATWLALDSVAETQAVSTPTGGFMMVSTGRRIPRLTGRDPATGRWVRLPLVDPRTRQWLVPPKLHCLADAIMAGRGQQPDARQAWEVAAGLRAMADDRLGFTR